MGSVHCWGGFLTGFIFISLKDDFLEAVAKTRWPALLLALGLYLARTLLLDGGISTLIAVDSYSWMLALFGFASLYLNKPSSFSTSR